MIPYLKKQIFQVDGIRETKLLRYLKCIHILTSSTAE